MTMTISEMKELNGECCQTNCDERATHYVFWPNQGKKLMCSVHTQQAEKISDVMGFRLHIESIPLEQPK